MKPVECEFESEVLGAVLEGRWPEGADNALRAHAAACRACSETAALAGAIGRSREAERSQAVVPESGRVWWLAQVRARREAVRNVGRPITAAQVIALACAMGLLGACFGATSTWFQQVLVRTGHAAAGVRIQPLLAAAASAAADHIVLVLAAAGLLLIVPAALCLAILRE